MAKATAKKVENYTADQTAEMSGEYTAASNDKEREQIVQKFAAKFGKTSRSIVAKLSREGVYVKPAKVSKVTGAAPVKKEELAKNLTAKALAAGVVLVSAEKLNKTDQQNLLTHFEALAAAEEADREAEEAANVGESS